MTKTERNDHGNNEQHREQQQARWGHKERNVDIVEKDKREKNFESKRGKKLTNI